jgi:hypothetical protein
MRIALGLLAAAFSACAHGGQCVARSGPHTAALVELYTSEGCSSCPPADRWLSSLASGGDGPQRVVPLALHVDYWDYIGWKDARRESPLRQRKLSQLQRLALVYTPQVMLQGRDFRGWGTPAFDDEVRRINARPERARIELELASSAPDAFVVHVRAAVLDPPQAEAAGLYLAAYEDRLQSHVVLEWQGPLAFSGAELAAERALRLLPGAKAAHSGVVAFVQNRRNGEVLQALKLAFCP